jgi:hypothetical protein
MNGEMLQRLISLIGTLLQPAANFFAVYYQIFSTTVASNAFFGATKGPPSVVAAVVQGS